MHSNPLSGMCPTPTPALCIALMQAQRRALDACHAYPSGGDQSDPQLRLANVLNCEMHAELGSTSSLSNE